MNFGPTAINAGTTWGIDTSAENNYGLGPSFQSTIALQRSQMQSDQAPSWWWLAAFVFLVAVFG